MARNQSPNPRDRIGIYKQLDDVPPERRFETDAEQYEGDETYCLFLETSSLPRIDSDRAARNARLAGRRWRIP